MNNPPAPGQPNGHADIPPGFRAAAPPEAKSPAELAAQQQQAIHDELAALLESDPAAVLQALPNLFGQHIANMVTAGVAAALQAVPVRVAGRLCATCLQLRLEWNGRNIAALEQAQAAAMARHGITDPADPRLAQIELPQFLPEGLRPGGGNDPLPMIADSVTTVGGLEVCPQHHPAAAAQPGGRRPLIVSGIGNVHLAAQMAMAAGPGMPGAVG